MKQTLASSEWKHEIGECITPGKNICDACQRKIEEYEMDIRKSVVRFLDIYPIAKRSDFEYEMCKVGLTDWIFKREMNIRCKRWIDVAEYLTNLKEQLEGK